MVKITVLNDNTPGRGFMAEHGLSFLIETNDTTVLLDAGPGEVFKTNAKKMHLDLHAIDAVVLSHGHWDHGNGMKYLPHLPLYAHPSVFMKRYHSNRNDVYVGLDQSEKQFRQHFDLHLTKEPAKLGDGIWYLGEIPRTNDFEAKVTAFYDEQGKEDFIPDDSGVVVKTEKGLIVVSGCAHAGIINTITQAQNITEEPRVFGVLGGFHLKKANSVTDKTVKALKNLHIPHIYPSHCTDLPALSIFFNTFGMNQIRTGDVLTFD